MSSGIKILAQIERIVTKIYEWVILPVIFFASLFGWPLHQSWYSFLCGMAFVLWFSDKPGPIVKRWTLKKWGA